MFKNIFIIFLFSIFFTSTNSMECGVKKVKIAGSFIRGGYTAQPGQWPWLASLFKQNVTTRKLDFFCGSTLINEITLLTAAHCIDQTRDSSLLAYIGRHNLENNNDVNSVTRKIIRRKIHVNYKPYDEKVPKTEADIGILIMESSVQFTNYIQPICLPSQTEKVTEVGGVVVGYGLPDIQSNHRVLPQFTSMTSVDLLNCVFSDFNSLYTVSKNSFCAKGTDGTACGGDSGGGFYRMVNSRWTLLGIVSHGLDNECSLNEFVVFVTLPKFLDWINRNSEKPSQSKVSTTKKSVIIRPQTVSLAQVGGLISKRHECLIDIECRDYNRFAIDFASVPNTPNYKINVYNIFVEWFEANGHKSFHYLPLSVFNAFPNILTLFGTGSGVRKIYKMNFKNCKQLKSVWLDHNEIQEIESGSFDDNTSLDVLYLGFNKLKAIDKTLFANLGKLRALSLEANQIVTLSDQTFLNLANLESIYLNSNPISFAITDKYFVNSRKIIRKYITTSP